MTPGEGASDLGGLEDRWVTSVLALDEHEREKLLTWVPVIKETIEKARQEADELAARLAGAERFSQISPTDPSNESRPGESASWTRQRHPWHLQPASMEVQFDPPQAIAVASQLASRAAGHRESDVVPRYLAGKRSSDTPVSPRKTA